MESLASYAPKGLHKRMAISIMRLTTKKTEQTSSTFVNEKTQIINRRGVFLWLPVFFCNDLVHGSWWFVLGSFLAMALPILVLVNPYIHIYETINDTLPALSFYVTWVTFLISNFFITLASIFFVFAFEEPTHPPLFPKCKHLQTHELCAAWLLLLGTVPGIPYAIYWYIENPGEIIYLGLLVSSSAFVFCSYLFVLAVYPSDKKHTQVIKPIFRAICGRDHWLIMHLQNDWLAGMWINLVVTDICLVGTVGLFLKALYTKNVEELFIYGITILDVIIFIVGCMYFVSGSYPEDKMQCYGQRDKDKGVHTSTGNPLNDECDDNDNDGASGAGRRADVVVGAGCDKQEVSAVMSPMGDLRPVDDRVPGV